MWSVIGHEIEGERFKRALSTGNLGHAYIISGMPHVGKMTLALALAQSLNCHQQDTPCGACHVCQRITASTHPDVRVVSWCDFGEKSHSRTEISIKQVRDDIQYWTNLPPFEGGYRVFIIEDAERLSSEAANCLLKTLEEPQEKVLFLLLCKDSTHLPETVVSRCQLLDLKPVAATKIEAALLARGLTAEKALLLSRLSRGCPGWALLAAFDNNVLERRGECLDCLLKVLSSSLEVRFEYAAELATHFAQKRIEVQEVLESLLGIWRDLLLLKADMSSEIVNLDYIDRLQMLAECFDMDGIRKGITAVNAVTKQLWQNVSPRLALEVMMLDMPMANLLGIKV